MIPKRAIIETIAHHFAMIRQWRDMSTSSLESATGYYYKAVALIEVLEVDDCGSVGGFGNEHAINKLKGKYDSLFARFLYYAIQYQGLKIENFDALKDYYKDR